MQHLGGDSTHSSRGSSTQKKEPKDPTTECKVDNDPQQLGLFLAQVWTYMQEYGTEIAIEGSKVWCVPMTLEGAAAW